MSEYRHAAVFIGILQPEKVRRIARFSHFERVRPGFQFARRIEHQVHPVPHTLADLEHICHFAFNRRVPPAVNLEGAVSQLAALFREIGEVFGRAKPTVLVAVIGACVSRNGFLVTTEKLINRRVERLSGKFP